MSTVYAFGGSSNCGGGPMTLIVIVANVASLAPLPFGGLSVTLKTTTYGCSFTCAQTVFQWNLMSVGLVSYLGTLGFGAEYIISAGDGFETANISENA